jgi:alanine dehydrogenase
MHIGVVKGIKARAERVGLTPAGSAVEACDGR